MNLTGTIFDIKRFAIHDGPGIRTTVFMKGCPLDCWWCHNPESIRLEPETVTRRRPVGSSTKLPDKQEVFGRRITVAELLAELEKDLIFYDQSGGGVTFSGGEPLMQVDFLEAALKVCRDSDIHTAVDSSGYAPWEDLVRIADLTDLFLYDLKLMDDEQHRKYIAVSNQTILNNLVRLAKRTDKITIRIPLIPDITDTDENLAAISEFLRPLENIKEVSLLPYNMFGRDKFEKLNIVNRLGHLKTQTKAEVVDMSRHFEACGCRVKIGG